MPGEFATTDSADGTTLPWPAHAATDGTWRAFAVY
jgi:hypothetical protein